MKRPLACSRRTLAPFGALAALCVAAVGCAGSLDPNLMMGGGEPVCDAPTKVFTPTCAQIGCHAASNPGGGLDLASSGVAARLLGKPSAGPANAVCTSNTTPYLVSGSNPATGFLLDKLKSPAPCGATMPEIGTLSASDSTCLNAWATAVTTGVITQ